MSRKLSKNTLSLKRKSVIVEENDSSVFKANQLHISQIVKQLKNRKFLGGVESSTIRREARNSNRSFLTLRQKANLSL